MAFIPYSRQQITDDDIAAVTAVLRSEFLTQGPAVPAFERAFADVHQVKHAIAVGNATEGLHIACLALGVGPGARVWTSPNSFLASANCALYCGATIDFVDIDPHTRNMSVVALAAKLEAARTAGTLPQVVIPVDFAGLPTDLREIRTLADRYGFRILQDASHATGARYLGAPVGSAWADATVFSFHAVKIVTTAEGGLVTTQDDALARELQLLRSHGMTRDAALMDGTPDGPWYYEQQRLGYNFRMTDLQAALGLSQLKRLDDMHAKRAARAERYDALLADLPVKRPARLADRVSAWHLYAIELSRGHDRRAVFEALRAAEIGVNVHYIPIHTQPHYQRLGFKRGDFPAAEAYYAQAISLPLFPEMTEAEQDRVVAVLRAALG
ncbi:UDP-4-amino-4,6-dideoxy-N-acetyl-beta-L-altrosamine transaminase [Aquincola sp. S2]|uniref:UDP-4-amino-4, 6-dideoxy-N-acetyl-beta-L-altrosamine transaminase n=1 Tax=Pseudaquabacterium terrae TaxID=2732868 RepID=A0ABX2ENX7_9BURK|nr:UDP-4-amino-4,6-dideoxy-N-acetyl-beta-L-altrosamine transaminase [Aquabacterium terrae]NRF70255.1 UDP-4-amino-4,6-dideoxy-N-acetyl-beta-L-altrosamine transaminase [Aquabacterium terrae]